jgi:hypothetical protein
VNAANPSSAVGVNVEFAGNPPNLEKVARTERGDQKNAIVRNSGKPDSEVD